MATLRELIIKISANSQSFQSEIQRASRMGSEYYRTLQNGGRQAAAAARGQLRAPAPLNKNMREK
ncbi:hypothetical protein, partial [Escherichia coli]|uniref:hypothetical protein n=1 Tax=Escherichia coli TaxID=562 RepID=UPI000B3F262D